MQVKKQSSLFSSLPSILILSAIVIFMLAGSVGNLLAQDISTARIPTASNTDASFSSAGLGNSFGFAAINAATATDLALAMGVPADDILAADLMGSDTDGVGLSDASLGDWFPTKSGTFAILATGLAADASLANTSESHTTILDGLNNADGHDMVRLHLQLDVPEIAKCLAFDFAFYSEEFEEYIGSQFNDAFTAQLNDSSLSIVNDKVVAPNNFAFDQLSNFIDINTVFGVTANTGTTYDGVTALLRATQNVTPNSVVDVYLSIQDLGDSQWDSAVFLDNFFWSTDELCVADTLADTDSDGLLDVWEEEGLSLKIDGVTEFVDLPAMGADPEHKDIFVEIDWMGPATLGAHTHKPTAAGIAEIVDAFDNAPVNNPDGSTGIHLHVDYGSDAPLTWGAGATWGALSDGDQLSHQENVSTCTVAANGDVSFSWSGFDTLKDANFSEARAAAFHYNIFAHDLCDELGSVSGMARDIPASNFIVSLGSWNSSTGTQDQQAGTFMHELGHSIGLRHGGPDHANYKPNYLSVMNYSFQTRGLIINSAEGNFDYSRYDLPDLDENNLDETVGLSLPALGYTVGTRYTCDSGVDQLDSDASAVNWNCDNPADESDTAVVANVNKSFDGATPPNPTYGTLTTHNDWDNLKFTGGAIGLPGGIIELPAFTDDPNLIDINEEQDDEIPMEIFSLNIQQGSINCKASKGVLPFAILSTSGFDALLVDHNTVMLAGAGETHINKKTGEARRHEEDVNDDGLMDLVFHVRLGETTLCDAGSEQEALLTGQLFDGQHFYGTDAVEVKNSAGGDSEALSEAGLSEASLSVSSSCVASFDGVAVYSPNMFVSTVFSVPDNYFSNGILDLNGDGEADTLADALAYNSSSALSAALSASVNGLLLADHSEVAYPLEWYEVVGLFNAAAAHGNGHSSAKLNKLVTALNAYNSAYSVESSC